jgi:acyl dehydratase
VRRADPFRLSVGDQAIADFGPGLLHLLNLADASGRRLGEGFAGEWVIPIAAAGTAAFAAVGEEFNPWTAASNTVTFHRAVRDGETVEATVEVASLKGTSVRLPYRIVGGPTRDPIAEGAFVFVCVGPNGPKRFDPRLVPRGAAEAVEVEAGRPPLPSAIGRPSWRARAAGAVLPRSLTRRLRLAYWHVLAQRGRKTSPSEFVSGLRSVWRSDAGRGTETPMSFRDRLLDVCLPPAAADALRAAWRAPRETARAGPIRFAARPLPLAKGQSVDLPIEISNPADVSIDAEVEIETPYGFGLAVDWKKSEKVRLSPGQSAGVSVRVTALRPDEVNLGRPWPLVCRLRAGAAVLGSDAIALAVADPDPGSIFYVLTEDCETFDGGETTGAYGPAGVLGNRNGFMDPEEYRVQMIAKPDALNAIAEKHGARWTHFWTAPQRFAAVWAAGRSKTGTWDAVVRELDESVRRGSSAHEYAPHIHFDYEPESGLPPQPRLVYDAKTDGILPAEYYDPATNPDHRYHGWDGARKGIAYVRREGDLSDVDSKKGSLRKSVRYLADLSFGGRLSRCTRTGAADFGAAPPDLSASARAAAANGLLANSDAGVYAAKSPLPRGRQVYFCRADDLDAEIEDLRDASLVELRAPDFQLEQGSLEDVNAWFDRRCLESRGPGVRAIVAMTHAMFVKGAPDPFRDTAGGDFDKLDQHLEYVARAHPDVRFATASEAALEFLDYYTPVPRAVALEARARSADGTLWIHPVRILGKGIPLPARLTVQAPPHLDAEEIRSLAVLDGGEPMPDASWKSSPAELASAEFTAVRREGYALRVETSRPIDHRLCGAAVSAGDAPAPLFEEAGDGSDARPDLLRLEPPELLRGEIRGIDAVKPGDRWEWRYPGDLFHLLVHPVAGNAHPLGRRLHPYGRYSEGIAIDAARRVLGPGIRPAGFELQWVRPVRGGADFRVSCVLEAMTAETAVMQTSVEESGVQVARIRLSLARG